jgi:hypothetical protein
MSDHKNCSKCNKSLLSIYFSKNMTWCKSCCKEYRFSRKNKIADDNEKYYSNHIEEISTRKREYYIVNKDAILLKVKSTRSETERKRLKNDLQYKLKKNISKSINKQLKINGSSKDNNSCAKYLPYSLGELKVHIENLFEPWMNWQNQGRYNPKTWDDNDQATWTWQIDHIVPHSKFKYTSMEDQSFQKCWALINLRPYSAKQNLLDGNRR